MNTQPQEDEPKRWTEEDTAWAEGWKTGFYSKDIEPLCPFNTQIMQTRWEQGLIYGSLAKAQMEEEA
jgi:hypothetical protein